MSFALVLCVVILASVIAAGIGGVAMPALMMAASREYAARLESSSALQLDSAARECDAQRSELAEIRATLVEMSGQLEHAEKKNAWLKAQLDERPYVRRKVYKILTVGIPSTGKRRSR